MPRIEFNAPNNATKKPPAIIVLGATRAPYLAVAQNAKYGSFPTLVIDNPLRMEGLTIANDEDSRPQARIMAFTLHTNDANQLNSNELASLNEFIELLTDFRDAALAAFPPIPTK